jgi:hypothetical protein
MSKRSSTFPILLLLLIFLVLTLVIPSHIANHKVHAAPQETIVRCEPASISSEFTTPVAFVLDAEPNIPSTQIEILDEFLAPDFVVRKVADNSAGTIWYANTQVNPSPPVSGSGALARVTLSPQKAGEFTLHFTHHELVLKNGVQIPTTARDCAVWFFDPDKLESIYLPAVLAQ